MTIYQEVQMPDGAAVAFPADDAEVGRILGEIAARARAHQPDVTTAGGRKEIASLAYKVAQSKTALDGAGKRMVEDAKREVARVDAIRRRIRNELDDLKAEVRRPLDEWEAAEEARVAEIEQRIDRIERAPASLPADATPEMVRSVLERITVVEPEDGSFQELTARAVAARTDAIAKLEPMIESAERRRAEAEELERLRAAERERERQEAEARAQKAADEDRQRREIEEARRVAREAEARAEAAEHAAREAEERSRREAEAAEARAKAEREREAAAERERLEAEARREASIAKAAEAMAAVVGKDDARAVVKAIAAGRIPHLTFNP